MIVNFRKTAPSRPYFLHILVNIPQDGSHLAVYPANWKNNYIIANGIVVSLSNIDPDKVYDYHTSFDIKPTEVSFNVDINYHEMVIIICTDSCSIMHWTKFRQNLWVQ